MQFLSTTEQPFKADDAKIKAALADLQEAEKAGGNTLPESAANALYWQGHIQEKLNNKDAAEALYKRGKDRFKDKPDLASRFEGALRPARRPSIPKPQAPPPPPPGGDKGARLPTLDYFPPALVLVPAQMPGGAPPPPPQQPPEAGFDFWKAMRLAGEQKYVEAIKLIDEAKKKHEARKLSQLGKPQNPQERSHRGDLRQDLRRAEGLLAASGEAARRRLPRGGGRREGDRCTAGQAQEDRGNGRQGEDRLRHARRRQEEGGHRPGRPEDDAREAKEGHRRRHGQAGPGRQGPRHGEEEGDRLAGPGQGGGGPSARIANEKKDLAETIVALGDKVGLRDIDPVRSRKLLFQTVDDVVEDREDEGPCRRAAVAHRRGARPEADARSALVARDDAELLGAAAGRSFAARTSPTRPCATRPWRRRIRRGRWRRAATL